MHDRYPHRWLLLWLPILLCGCDLSTSVEDLRDRIDPPSRYRVLWTLTQGCSGLERDFGGVKWFWTEKFPGQPGLVGQWNEKREITIVFSRRDDELVVMHEILHDLLRGDKNHESPLWERCQLPKGDGG